MSITTVLAVPVLVALAATSGTASHGSALPARPGQAIVDQPL